MLGAILKIMYNDSKAVKNRPVNRTLKGGLHLSLYNDGKDVILTIARDGKEPSDVEWITVLKKFPFPVPATTKPEKTFANHRPALRARLEIPTEVQLSF